MELGNVYQLRIFQKILLGTDVTVILFVVGRFFCIVVNVVSEKETPVCPRIP